MAVKFAIPSREYKKIRAKEWRAKRELRAILKPRFVFDFDSG
jgi:hypothetical protein